ncbi:6735_t:CDS:2 [Ambispora gerdemannii]|uniref:Mediator of RNA polymerase II transcription subunit 18 n=1 Tax=Ambispora gerdemannii TaxID=144530 RepID=A0A9N8UWJ1_9GLOM|nr:6735_t:CDS:2 [Ambispora gerdemannii]
MTFECLLYGRISNPLKPKLFERLMGICGKEPVDIFELEFGFVPTLQTPVGPARNEDVLLRLKSPLDEKDLSQRQWQLCQIGHPETTEKKVTVRRVIYSRITQGNTFAFEFVRKGSVFIYEDIIKISITQIYELENLHDPTSLKPFDPQNFWVVEVLTFSNEPDVPLKASELEKLASNLTDQTRTQQRYLRFRNFHAAHFSRPRQEFFLHALNPTSPPWTLWNINRDEEWEQEGEQEIADDVYYEEGHENNGWKEEEEEENVEFVLSEEAIAMFRFSELRKLELEKEYSKIEKVSIKNQNNSQIKEISSEEEICIEEPHPSYIRPTPFSREQMRELYGEDGYQSIECLEAAVNATFEQSFLKHNSQKSTVDNNNNIIKEEEEMNVVYWPVLPLRFV